MSDKLAVELAPLGVTVNAVMGSRIRQRFGDPDHETVLSRALARHPGR